MFLGKGASGAGLQIFFECECLRLVVEADLDDQFPRPVHGGMVRLGIGLPRIVPFQAFGNIACAAGVIFVRKLQALKDVDVLHGGSASAKAPAGQPSPTSRLARPSPVSWLAQPKPARAKAGWGTRTLANLFFSRDNNNLPGRWVSVYHTLVTHPRFTNVARTSRVVSTKWCRQRGSTNAGIF